MAKILRMNSHLVTMFCIPLNVYSQVGLLAHLVVPSSNLERSTCTVSMAAMYFIFPSTVYRAKTNLPGSSLSSQDQPVYASLDAPFVPFIS